MQVSLTLWSPLTQQDDCPERCRFGQAELDCSCVTGPMRLDYEHKSIGLHMRYKSAYQAWLSPIRHLHSAIVVR